MNRKRTPIRSVVILAVMAMCSALFFNATPAGSNDGTSGDPVVGDIDGDGLRDDGGDDVAPPTPDDYEIAAAENQLLEDAAAADDVEPGGGPIVPQSPGVPTLVTEPDDHGAAGDDEAVIDTQPAQGASATLAYNEAVPGTASTVTFEDATPLADLLAEDVELSTAVQEHLAAAKRHRIVRVAAPDLSEDLAAQSVTMELFADVSLELETNVAPSPGQMNSTVWSSVPADGATGNPFSVVTMIDDRVYGGWWYENTAFEMVPLGNGDHLIYEVDGVLDDDPEHWEMVSEHDNGPSGLTGAELGVSEDFSDLRDGDTTEDTIAAPNIDVMVAYDQEVEDALGSHQDAVDLAILNVNLSNMTFLNSGAEAPQNFTLTNVYATNYTPTTTVASTYRSQLANKTDGTFDAIHTVRDANFADFVVLLFNRTLTGSTGNSLCGQAYFPTSANPAENDAYNVTKRTCATTTGLTFPHELGHNQCAGHDSTGGNCSTYTNDLGYVDASTSQRTIMARNSNTCCTRRPVWSNPSITWNGWTPGSASTDNNAVLEAEDLSPGTVSGGVANYRVNPVGSNTAVAGTDGVSCAFNTIEDAITLAPAGSTIYISPGTHAAQSSTFNYNISKDLDLEQGTALCEPTVGGAANNVVLTLASGSTSDAVLEVSNNAQVRLERITVQGGNSAEGTLYVLTGADVTLDAAVVEDGNNPSTSVGGGGVRISGSTSSLTSINTSFIRDNSSSYGGGGVYVDAGTLTVDGTDDITNNTAPDGGGVYATNNADVTLMNNADVINNTATDDGGGLYIDNSTLTATGSGTDINSNDATASPAGVGGGVYGLNGSTVTIGGFAGVDFNDADFGGGVYMSGSGSEMQLDEDATVNFNTSTSNGGGVVVTNSALGDVNAGAVISGNTASGWGGGVAVFTPATLDADGGTPIVDPVLIDNNTAGTTGGGVWASGTAFLDTVHIEDNDAADGGGLYVSGLATVSEDFACQGGDADLGFERYCNEFSRNTATGTGSAVVVAGGTFTAVQAGFLGNTTGNAVVHATGAATVDVRAAMFLNNTTSVAADGIITALDTADINLVGVTFADNDDWDLDSDGASTVWNVDRVISGNGIYALNNRTGSCNIRQTGATGGNLPGGIPADVRFETNDDTDYMPAPRGPAADRCAQLAGHNSDALDYGVKDADGVATATEYDVGGIEADRQPVLSPFFAIIAEGNAGITNLQVPVNLDMVHTEPITIDWFTVDNGAAGVATANVDYIQSSGTVTFLPGSTQEFVTIPIIGDVTPEPDLLFGEWILILYTNISENAELDVQSFFGLGVGVIFNDDGPPP